MFLYLAYQAVHSANRPEDPLQAPQEWIDKFKHIKHRKRRKYAAMVAYMDYGIGRVSLLLIFGNFQYFIHHIKFYFKKNNNISFFFLLLVNSSHLASCVLTEDTLSSFFFEKKSFG